MKFNPKTHQTRCGAPWRDLKIKGQDYYIAVKDSLASEMVVFVGANGKAYDAFDTDLELPRFDLVPIDREHNLPKGLASKWKYAAKDENNNVCLYADTPKRHRISWRSNSEDAYQINLLFPNAIKDTPWDSGYFERIGDSDEWEFVEAE